MTDKIHQSNNTFLKKKTYREDTTSTKSKKVLDLQSLKIRIGKEISKSKDQDTYNDNQSTMDSNSSYENYYEDYIQVIFNNVSIAYLSSFYI
jgi:hypothetical protein